MHRRSRDSAKDNDFKKIITPGLIPAQRRCCSTEKNDRKTTSPSCSKRGRDNILNMHRCVVEKRSRAMMRIDSTKYLPEEKVMRHYEHPCRRRVLHEGQFTIVVVMIINEATSRPISYEQRRVKSNFDCPVLMQRWECITHYQLHVHVVISNFSSLSLSPVPIGHLSPTDDRGCAGEGASLAVLYSGWCVHRGVSGLRVCFSSSR